MTMPILPQIDYKLGNPQLPVQVEEYGIADLDSFDFTNCPNMMELAERIEEIEDATSARQNFSQSPLIRIKIQSNHFMIQGSISIESQKGELNEIEDGSKSAVFSFPESIAENIN